MDIDFAVVNAAQLVTVGRGTTGARCGEEQGEIEFIERGALVGCGGRIAAVGTTKEINDRFDLSNVVVHDASKQVVMPGFVDCHTHPVFAGLRYAEYAELLRGKTKDEVVRGGGGIWRSVVDTRATPEGELRETLYKYLSRMLEFGTTTIEAKSGYGLTIDSELLHLSILRDVGKRIAAHIVPTFLGAHIIPRDSAGAREYTSIIIDKMLPRVAEQGIAQFCDVSYGSNTFPYQLAEEILVSARKFGLRGRVHTDGSESIGGWRFACKQQAISADHLTFTPDDEIDEVGSTETVAVLIPAAELYYKTTRRANARHFIRRGVPVAIASDFCSSIHCGGIYSCLALAAAWYGMSPEEVISSVTVNAARALCMEDEIGSLSEGKRADLVFLNIPDYRMIAFEFGLMSIDRVMIGGNVVVSGGRVV